MNFDAKRIGTYMDGRHRAYLTALEQIKTGPVREAVLSAIEATKKTYERNGTVYACGNGGSAADSQHFAAELRDTPGARFRAYAFNDVSSLTAIGNDYGFEKIFEHQLRTMGREGDVLYGISTSGKAVNVQRALDAAKEMKIYRIGIVGNGPKSIEIVRRSDTAIIIPSQDTQIIQQCYLMMLHDIWMSLKEIFGVP
jgi:D-sedoheptulose 7-phosphate isomerase